MKTNETLHDVNAMNRQDEISLEALDTVSGGVVGTLGVLGLAYVGVCTVAFLKGMQAGMK